MLWNELQPHEGVNLLPHGVATHFRAFALTCYYFQMNFQSDFQCPWTSNLVQRIWLSILALEPASWFGEHDYQFYLLVVDSIMGGRSDPQKKFNLNKTQSLVSKQPHQALTRNLFFGSFEIRCLDPLDTGAHVVWLLHFYEGGSPHWNSCIWMGHGPATPTVLVKKALVKKVSPSSWGKL